MSTPEEHLSFHFSSAYAVCVQPFSYFSGNFTDLHRFFERYGRVIHADRNTLKEFLAAECPDLCHDVVIKSFRKPSFLSSVIYTFFRPSKAKRSFYNSLLFQQSGFNVPAPLAFVECRRAGLLGNSYFISEKKAFDCTLHEVFRQQMFCWNEVLPLVVEQAYAMHQKGLMHRDFSPGNVLVCKIADTYEFSFVDLNRLKQGGVDFEQGLKSFIRLAHDKDSIDIIAHHYAALAGREQGDASLLLEKAVKRHWFIKDIKNWLKRTLGLKKKQSM